MTRYVLAPAARQDLDDITEYVARDSITAAAAMLDRFEAAFALLAERPGLGRRYHLGNREVRIWPVATYLVVYRLRQPVEIVRLIDGRRDLYRLLGIDVRS